MLNFTLIHFRNSNSKDTKINVKYFKFQQIPNGVKVETRWVTLVKSLITFHTFCMWQNGNNVTFFSVFLDYAPNTVQGLSPDHTFSGEEIVFGRRDGQAVAAVCSL